MNFWKNITYAAILSVLFNICFHVYANPAFGIKEENQELKATEKKIALCNLEKKLLKDLKNKQFPTQLSPEGYQNSNSLMQPIELASDVSKSNFKLLARYIQQKNANLVNKQALINELDKTIDTIQNNNYVYDQGRTSYKANYIYYDQYYLHNFDTDPADSITGSSLMNYVNILSFITKPGKKKN